MACININIPVPPLYPLMAPLGEIRPDGKVSDKKVPGATYPASEERSLPELVDHNRKLWNQIYVMAGTASKSQMAMESLLELIGQVSSEGVIVSLLMQLRTGTP
jgi:hypothetical protein